MQKKKNLKRKLQFVFENMAWGVMCYWKKMKVFNQVKLTLFEYSLFIFKVSWVWVIIFALNEKTALLHIVSSAPHM